MNDDFYIGWKDENPGSFRKATRKFWVVTAIVILVFGCLFVWQERGFISSYFEFGTLTEVSGTLVNTPVWAIKTEGEKGQTIPLVGFGKFGPDATLAAWKEKHPEVGDGSQVKVRGTRFGYQGRVWLELTEGPESLLEVGNKTNAKIQPILKGEKIYCGEIVDPKCFFGVMNPSDKAVHRSCAIRCISGGNPPMLVIRESGEFVDYLFLKGPTGERINSEVLSYVGLPVSISGVESVIGDWKQLELGEIMLDTGSLSDQICSSKPKK